MNPMIETNTNQLSKEELDTLIGAPIVYKGIPIGEVKDLLIHNGSTNLEFAFTADEAVELVNKLWDRDMPNFSILKDERQPPEQLTFDIDG